MLHTPFEAFGIGKGGRRLRAHAGLGIPKRGPRNVIGFSSGNNWTYFYLSSLKMSQIVGKVRRSLARFQKLCDQQY